MEVGSAIIGAVIAGALGILTAWWIERRQQRTLQRTLATSLIAEISLIQTAIQGLVNNKPEEADAAARVGQLRAMVSLDRATHIFDQNTDKIGFLGRDLARDLIHFYYVIKQHIGIGVDLGRLSDEEAILQDFYTKNYLDSIYSLVDGMGDLIKRLEHHV